MKATILLALTLLVPLTVAADPSESRAPWSGASMGFQWQDLGPKTVAVDLSRYTTVRHVSPAGSDERGDGSRAQPWRSIGRALASASSDGRTAILVAAGTYKEGVLAMRPRVDLLGGFEAPGWSRDIFANSTILSGGGEGRVLTGANDATLDGFIVTEGVVRGHGGALLCDNASPSVTNNVFHHNRTLAPETYPRDPESRRIRGNDGGAIALVNYSNAEIRNNLFHDNETGVGYGGALCASHDNLSVITHNVFWGNRAGVADTADTRSGNGGAVGLLFSARPAIMNNLFAANASGGHGDGGALFMEYFCWPEVHNNAFVHNISADDGGGIDHQKFSYPKIRANLFYGNRAAKSGGGAHMDDSTAEMENNILAYNHAAREGGGVGGTHGWVHAVNNTIVYNTAGRDGGGVQLINIKNPFLRPQILRNNLIAFNEPEQVRLPEDADTGYNIMHPGGYVPGYYNKDIKPGFRDNGSTLSVRTIREDPGAFATALVVGESIERGSLVGRIARVGDHWSMVRSNDTNEVTLWGPSPPGEATALEVLPTFHLSPDSGAINSGVYPDFAPFDIDGEPRASQAVDIGADEYHPTPIGRN